MKYFTPELLARCRSLEDVAEAAAEELEQASDAYRTRLKALRPSLPPGVRRLVSTVSLHDAKVLNVSFGKRKPRFALRLRLEGINNQPGEVLELSYRVVAGPNGGVAVRRHPQGSEGPKGVHWVLNNEFDVDEERGFFTHCILLTSGVEIEIRFHALSVQYLEEVVAPLQLDEEARTWPLVEA
jgi:hypothetical protein